MRISDWSSDVCSSDLDAVGGHGEAIFDEGDAPTDQDDGEQGFVHPALQVPIPGGGHEQVGNGEEQDGRHGWPWICNRGAGERKGMSAPVLDTKLSAESESFRANAAHNRALRDELREKVAHAALRSEEHTSELQSLMRISYAVFCL